MYTINNVNRGLNDLRQSLKEDVFPIIKSHLAHLGTGRYIIPREVFCYVDFLGALYSGFNCVTAGRHRRRIATPDKTKKFIKEIFGKIDPVYEKYGELAYDMYRHGAVHLYKPFALKRPDGMIIEWSLKINKGKRQDDLSFVATPHRPAILLSKVRHLTPYLLNRTEKRWLLPIFTTVLYEDLLKAIDLYEQKIKTQAEKGDNTLLENYGSTVKAILEPEDTNLTW